MLKGVNKKAKEVQRKPENEGCREAQLQRRRGRREAKSRTVRPEGSNSIEQELSVVKRRIERRL